MNEQLNQAMMLIVDGLITLQKELAREQAKALVEELSAIRTDNTQQPAQRFTAMEAAEYLGICRESVYKLARAKELEHFKVGGKLLFNRQDLDAWVQKGGCAN